MDLLLGAFAPDPMDPGMNDPGFGEPGIPGAFIALFVIVLILGVAGTVWQVSTARRMARDAGLDPDDAAAVTLLDDPGLSTAYLASSLRDRDDRPEPPPAARSSAERLRELQDLRDQGLITPDEYDARRRAIVDSL